MLPEVHLCKQMTLMHVNLGGSKKASPLFLLNHTESIGGKLEHFQESSPSDRKRALIENDFRLLKKRKRLG